MSEIQKRTREGTLGSLTGHEIEEALSALPFDLEVTLHRAEDLLSALPPISGEWEKLTQWRVRRLGESGEGEGRRGASPDRTLIHLLSARREPFSIGLRGSRDGSLSFLVGRQDPEGAETRGVLRAAYTLAETEPFVAELPAFQSWAVCRLVRMDPEDLTGEPPEDALPGWMDALAQAGAGMEYDVRMIFQPLERNWLEDRIRETAEYLDSISSCRESKLQFSGSTNHPPAAKIDHAVKKLWISLFGDEKSNDSGGFSISQEYQREHSRIAVCYEELQFHGKRLRQLLLDGGWSVSVQACAVRREELSILESVLGGALVQNGYRCAWQAFEPAAGLLLPGFRLNEAASFPRKAFPGLSFERVHAYEANLPALREDAASLGSLVWNGSRTKLPFQIPISELNRHAFVCGMTGSGKSNTVCGLLSALEGVPFLVVEPVKGEYWSLKDTVPGGVEIYHMDPGSGGHLAFNPFWFPEGGSLAYHIAGLKSIISAAFDLYAAMPNILEQCLTSAYVKKGWKIAVNRNIYAGKLPEEMLYPTFSTLCNEIETYLNRSDFSERLKGDYKGALLTRLQSFTTGTKGMLLNCPSISRIPGWIENKTNCVLELEALADDADKAIVMGSILHQYFQCVKGCGAGPSDRLRHVTVLEEAHHLFREGGAGEGGSTSRQQLVETLNNLLAEIRAYGEGILIVDQSPTGISPQVIKNTAVKIVHRVDYGDDLEVLQRALLLDREDRDAPASLERGFALVRFGAMKKPAHVSIPLCQTKERGGIHRRAAASSFDSGFLLALLLSNDKLRLELEAACGKLANHLLFDGLSGCRSALYYVLQTVQALLSRLGYDQHTIQTEFHAGALSYILRNTLEHRLSQAYPDQFLLCGRIQLAAERFISIETGRKDGIRAGEWKLLSDYRASQIFPILRDVNRNSADSLVRFFAHRTHYPAMAGVLRTFADEWSRQEKLCGRDALLARSPRELKDILMKSGFFEGANERVASALWETFQFYLDLQKDAPEAPEKGR